MADDNITQWLRGLAQGDPGAIQQVWTRYCRQLAILAHRKLAESSRRAADEEDVALSAFYSFCRGAVAGRFPQLEDRQDLWKLLITITARKAAAHLRRSRRRKRGGGAVRGESAFLGRDPAGRYTGIDQVLGREPSPELAAQVAEECEHLLSKLPDEDCRRIAVWKLEGFSNDEIAQQLQCAPRTVERKLAKIRTIWADPAESVA